MSYVFRRQRLTSWLHSFKRAGYDASWDVCSKSGTVAGASCSKTQGFVWCIFPVLQQLISKMQKCKTVLCNQPYEMMITRSRRFREIIAIHNFTWFFQYIRPLFIPCHITVTEELRLFSSLCKRAYPASHPVEMRIFYEADIPLHLLHTWNFKLFITKSFTKICIKFCDVRNQSLWREYLVKLILS